MPNHCHNRITVHADHDTRKAIIDECFIGEDFNFMAVVPYPEGFDPELVSGSRERELHTAFYDPSGFDEYGHYRKDIDWRGSREDAAKLYREQLADPEYYRNKFAPFRVGGTDEEREASSAAFFEKYPTAEALAAGYQRNIDITGFMTWYEWNCCFWGTKWNAYECSGFEENPVNDTLSFSFNTAWSPPSPVLQAMSDKYGVVVENHWNEEGGEYGMDHFHPAPPIYDEQEAIA